MIKFDCNPLGLVSGEGGQLDILPGVVKILDVAFISWARFPEERLPRRPIPSLIPDLAVEVLSETNPGQSVFGMRNGSRNFSAGDQTVIDQLLQPLVQHLSRNSGNKPLDLTWAIRKIAFLKPNRPASNQSPQL